MPEEGNEFRTMTEDDVNWKAIACALWDLLDQVDTASDMFRPDRSIYREFVHEQAVKRYRLLESRDGYGLTVTPGWEEHCKPKSLPEVPEEFEPENEVPQLWAADLEPVPTVIERFEEWLAMAKTGRVRGAIILGVTTAGKNVRSRMGEVGYANGIYLCRVMEHDILHDAMEEDTHHTGFPPSDD